MAILDIVKYPNPILLEKSKIVWNIKSDEMASFLQSLEETMYATGGIGIAAIQVGNPSRIFILNVGSEDERETKVFINPSIRTTEDEPRIGKEGCLSFPGLTIQVLRKPFVEVTAQDEQGEEFTWEADGLLSRAVQHEMDHLDGGLFIDRLGHLKRQMTIKKYLKVRK